MAVRCSAQSWAGRWQLGAVHDPGLDDWSECLKITMKDSLVYDKLEYGLWIWQ